MGKYDALTIGNRSFVKRFTHRKRFMVAKDLLQVRSTDRFLDYGTGDGYMLSLLLAERACCEVVGFEPDPNLAEQARDRMAGLKGVRSDLSIIENTESLPSSSFDKICCLEVLEHLPGSVLREVMRELHRVLRDGGRCVISVPIEIGVSGAIKNVVRLLLGQAHEGTSIRSIVRSSFGLSVDRASKGPFISSHIGFDYRKLPELFKGNGWQIIHSAYSPFPWFGGVFNSQIFFVLAKVSED